MQIAQMNTIHVNFSYTKEPSISVLGAWTWNCESLLLVGIDNGHRLYVIRMVNIIELIQWFGDAN